MYLVCDPLSKSDNGTQQLSCAVLGVGSAHGDDQIGWSLIDHLLPTHRAHEISFEKIAAPGASLLSYFQRYDRILVIDACKQGMVAGDSVLIANAADQLLSDKAPATGFSSHAFSVVDAYKLAKELQIPLPHISLFLIEIEQTDVMASISDKLQQRVPDYVQSLERHIRHMQLDKFDV